jgi:hypothetical protein
MQICPGKKQKKNTHILEQTGVTTVSKRAMSIVIKAGMEEQPENGDNYGKCNS